MCLLVGDINPDAASLVVVRLLNNLAPIGASSILRLVDNVQAGIGHAMSGDEFTDRRQNLGQRRRLCQ